MQFFLIKSIKIAFLGIVFTLLLFFLSPALAAPGVTIIETEGSTYVTEGGSDDQYFMVLTEAPTANVTVFLHYNSSQILVSSDTLLFTPLNWNIPQMENVSAVDDGDKEGTTVEIIKGFVMSSDPAYNGIIVDWVAVQIADNEYDSVSIHGKVIGYKKPPAEPPGEPPPEEEGEEPSEEGPSNIPPSTPEEREKSKEEELKKFYENIPVSSLLRSLPVFVAPLITALLSAVPIGLMPGMALLSQVSDFWGAVFRLPLALFLWKPKKPWSVIYNSTTKAPLKWSIFVVKTVDDKVFTRVVADEKGRFHFRFPKDRFKGEAQAARFVFPSSLVSTDYDEPYGKVYHGEIIDPTKRGIADLNCPLDPLQIDSPRAKYIKTVSFIGKAIFVFGMGWSIYATYVDPVWWNIVVCLLYFTVILLYVGFSYKRVASVGMVKTMDTDQPINNVWLYLIDTKTNKIVDMRLTDKTGQYQLYAPPGQFVLKAMHNLYKPVEIDIPYYAKERTIHEEIRLEKLVSKN